MDITYESLFERIRESPLEHIGGYSPQLIFSYFVGYEHGIRHYGKPAPKGFGPHEQRLWSLQTPNANPASVSELMTDTDADAFDLFFAFYRRALDNPKEIQPGTVEYEKIDQTLTEFVLGESIRKRPAMYFGNEKWLPNLWAFCSGYLWAERDMGITDSADRQTFNGFQAWLDERYPFAKGRNWGKLMSYLGLGSSRQALDKFYDHFETFLEGTPPDGQTKQCREWIQAVLENVKERGERGEL